MTNGMQRWKRVANTLIAIIFAAGAAIGAASAQTYPSKLIKIICPYPSGSVLDVTARLVTNALAERLGKPVIVDNRPGGGGTIGVGEFVRTSPDGGHTLLFGELSTVFAA